MTEFKRFKRERTKGWRKPENTINVTRPGKWGNPYKVKVHGREKSVELFKTYIDAKLASREVDISELKGHNLMCWCNHEGACHADYLLELASK